MRDNNVFFSKIKFTAILLDYVRVIVGLWAWKTPNTDKW